jgi:hypothetical protein
MWQVIIRCTERVRVRVRVQIRVRVRDKVGVRLLSVLGFGLV